MKNWPLLLLWAAGCATAQPVHTTADVQTFKATKPEVAGQAVDIRVDVITYDNAGERKDIWARIRTNEANQVGMQRGSSTINTHNVSLLPLPAFQIYFRNHSGKPIQVSAAQLELRDSSGKVYPHFKDARDVASHVERVLTGSNISADNETLDKLNRIIDTIPFMMQPREIKDGETWAGVAVFKLEVYNAKEFHHLLNKVQGFELSISNVGLTLPLSKASATIKVICPNATTPPSVERCPQEL